MRTVLTVLAGVALGLGGALLLQRAASETAGPVQQSSLPADPRGDLHTIDVIKSDDERKPGTVRGVVGWKFFDHISDEGSASPDQLRFKFSAPARIHQVHISVDVTDRRLHLAEFMVGRNISLTGH